MILGARLVAIVLLAALAGGCGIVGAGTPAEQVAVRIRAADSALVGRVVFRPANMFDDPRIDVWLRPGATESQAEALWCDIVVPAGGSSSNAETGTVIWNDSGTQMMANDPAIEC
jgi:hypothetical protein